MFDLLSGKKRVPERLVPRSIELLVLGPGAG